MTELDVEDLPEGEDSAEAPGGARLICPIRGELKIRRKTADGLSILEEARRIDGIKYLLSLGIPKEHILLEPIVRRLGNAGRNSARADIAVTDEPAAQVKNLPIDERIKHCSILGEFAKDGRESGDKIHNQVIHLLKFGRPGVVAFYWDNSQQRVFWEDENRNEHEGDITLLPRWGETFAPGAKRLTITDLRTPKSIKDVFSSIADELHAQGVAEQERYQVVLQLLLTKLYDERIHDNKPDDALLIQDPIIVGMDGAATRRSFQALLKQALTRYNALLPKPLPEEISISDDALRQALSRIAGFRLDNASGNAVQDLYMWFARKLYRSDLAEYFTPPSLTEFIVKIVAPQAHEWIKDPAVGSADFLMAAERIAPGVRDGVPRLYGADISVNGVMASNINALLHSASDITEIRQEDSLAHIDGEFSVDRNDDGKYQAVITNPPFGTRITVKDPEVLAKFELGYEWADDGTGKIEKTDKLMKSQQAGILFVEAAIRQVQKGGGRIAIVLPNGYLGNRSMVYHALRSYMLCHCKIVAITAFPRFAFKGSGADVSASVVYMERRAVPLTDPRDDSSYVVAIEMLERLGWVLGQKKEPIALLRDPADGSVTFDDNGDPITDADFDKVLARLAASAAHDQFPWLAQDTEPGGEPGHTVPVSTFFDDATLCMDPKRYSEKALAVRNDIMSGKHFTLRDVAQYIPQMTERDAAKLPASAVYRYVEISNVGPGLFSGQEVRGWELPKRARHKPDQGDLLIGGVWGSVSKWFIATDEDNVLATNGFHRLRIADRDRLLDVVAGLCTEGFAVQARAIALGSDGLAEVAPDDLMNVVFPVIEDPDIRAELMPFVDNLLDGHVSLKATIDQLYAERKLPMPYVAPRPSHVVLV